jgi:DNA repair exonuclease SbcCD ATPase subunit
MITFRSVKWRNLLSTGNYWTEIKLDGNDNTLIVGGNGSGKSTMLDALCFGLFGKAFRNINKPNLINSINGKDCSVEVVFSVNNKTYRIVRGIKPNVFEIYCDGLMLNQDAAARDYQEYLEKFILKMNYKSFTQIVILGSASFTPFMQLSASDRRSIIEDLLDIQIFSTMNGVLKEKLNENKDTVSTKKNEIVLAEQKIELHSEHIEQRKIGNQTKIAQHETEILTNQTHVQNLHSQVETMSAQVIEYTNEISKKLEIENKVKSITKLESQIENNLSKYRKDIGFFQTSDSCPTCRQSIAQVFKDKELTSLTDKAQKCEHGLSELAQKLNEEQAKLTTFNEIQKKIQKIQVDIASTNATINATNKYISKLNSEIESLRSLKDNTENEERQLKLLQSQVAESKKELKELLEQKTYFEVASVLLKDSGIKTKIIKQYLPVINKLVNKYLAALDFFVNFNLDESFKETIKSRHRDDFSYHNFSEGEKQRIDMALMLTWRAVAKLKNSSNTNLLILDETFDSSLDTNGTEELMKLLNMLEGVNLFVISHKGDILQDKFANTIRFVKEKNFSRISK